MFYRRKLVLALLQLFEGNLERTRLHKLLFLVSQQQVKKEYDFIPYKFGCFSFSVQADMETMVRKGIMAEEETAIMKVDRVDYIKQLRDADQKLLLNIKALYGKMGHKSLTKHTYINFPYYAINSEILTDILPVEDVSRVHEARPASDATILFTIGYEGISLEEYLNRLIRHDVKVLVDVRKNPLSQKFGFSKAQLRKYCENVGIHYVHFPEVGIDSSQRQELNSQADYDKLFSIYKSKNLSSTVSVQENIVDLLSKYKRVALTCFEANICQCHRMHLAEAVAGRPKSSFPINHI
ncbi:DUF488 domain-containing protein [Pontibacter russatus]|uniref:DUF488 domain-containing protein n=1 Tax=Pontibacter russatus TaxID=2694929 RepID=UPI00137AC744|nr:DUF488 domain-containing protein [Pontibacter russatus]